MRIPDLISRSLVCRRLVFPLMLLALGALLIGVNGRATTPYVLANSVVVIFDIDLTPNTDTNPVGTTHMLTAEVTSDYLAPGTPVVGTLVTFEVIGGPNVGTMDADRTDASGMATFTYTGTAVGTDTIEATFVDSNGATQRSNRVTKEWTNTPPDCSDATPSTASLWPSNHKFVPVNVIGVTDPDGDPITITITSIFQDEAVNADGSGDTSPDGQGVGTSTAEVRAERVAGGNGRVYHILFTAEDGKGGECSDFVRVGVPHDQRPGSTIIDEGPLFDSTS